MPTKPVSTGGDEVTRQLPTIDHAHIGNYQATLIDTTKSAIVQHDTIDFLSRGNTTQRLKS
jgi:hypothetical protein